MPKLIILLIVFVPFIFAAKETRKIVRERIYPELSEVYYVLKSDTTIRHGSYKAGTMTKILVEGQYNLGLMDSIWTEYNLEGRVVSRGWYEKNNRDSIWEFFDDKGDIEQRIDFRNNSILQYRTPYANHVFKIMTGDSTFISKLDRPPLYIGGASRFSTYFRNEIAIPLHKPDDKVLGTVHVAFTIDSLGVTSNHHALKGISKICSEEAVRAIKSIPDQWIPGVFNGRHVTVEYIVVVVFDENTRTTEF